MQKLLLILVALISPSLTFAANIEPNDVVCNGLPDYPKGARLNFPKGASVGDSSGFSLAYTSGKVSILYFEYMTKINKNTIEGEVTSINTLEDFKVDYKNKPVKCTVKTWH